MRILFLTLQDIFDIKEKGIYTDLIRSLKKRNVDVFVVAPNEKRTQRPTELIENESIKILKVKTGNITKTSSFIEKGISTLTLESYYLRAIKKHFDDIHFDMILYSTPPITFNRILKYFKEKSNSINYLMLKDIFPQNAVDIGLMKKKSIIYKYFRNKEKKLYDNSDFIGCMSQANIEYIKRNNKQIPREKIELFPNCIEINKVDTHEKNDEILLQHNIPQNKTVFIYGGNLGKPQGIDYILNVVSSFYKVKNAHLVIVGSGTEYNKIENHLAINDIKNVTLISKLPKIEYDELLKNADVGLIFLDNRFTIPNFPSRLTSYLEYSIPVLAATDVNTDVGKVIHDGNFGLWTESKSIDTFFEHANKLSLDKQLRRKMGNNGRKYLEEYYDVEIYAQKLIDHIKDKRG